MMQLLCKSISIVDTWQSSEAVARRCSVKNIFLEISPKFTGKHLCQSLFLNKVAGLRPATLLKKRLLHKCFPVNSAKFLITPFPTEHLRWLLLEVLNTSLEGVFRIVLKSFETFKKIYGSAANSNLWNGQSRETKIWPKELPLLRRLLVSAPELFIPQKTYNIKKYCDNLSVILFI